MGSTSTATSTTTMAVKVNVKAQATSTRQCAPRQARTGLVRHRRVAEIVTGAIATGCADGLSRPALASRQAAVEDARGALWLSLPPELV
jgi:hypothetical protein